MVQQVQILTSFLAQERSLQVLVDGAAGLKLRRFQNRYGHLKGWERYFEGEFLLVVLGFRIPGGKGSVVSQISG